MNDNNILSDKINIKLVYLLTRIVPFSKVFGMASAKQQFTQYISLRFIHRSRKMTLRAFGYYGASKRPY